MKIKSFTYQTSLGVLALFALGLAHTAQAQTFTQRITYTPTGGVLYDTIEAFAVGDADDSFAKPGLSNFDDAAPSSWSGRLRDRRSAIAVGIAPGSTTPVPLSFDLNFEGAQRALAVDLVVWDGGPRNGAIVDAFRVSLDGSGGYDSDPLPESRISWCGVPARFIQRADITIPGSGRAAPYPGTIKVRGFSGKVSKVTVEVKGLTHARPSDLQFLLVGPRGQKALFMANAGGATACNRVTLIFDDSATAAVPAPLVSGTRGTFKPTVLGTPAAFPGPAPVGPYGSALSVFNNTLPNGLWSLYVFDNLAGAQSSGIVRAWILTIQ